MKKFIKPVLIFFIVLVLLSTGVLIGSAFVNKKSNAKPEVLKTATKSAGKELAMETEKQPTLLSRKLVA